MTKAEMDFVVRFCKYIRCAHKIGEYDEVFETLFHNANAEQKAHALRMFEYCVANALKLDGLLDVLVEQ